MVEMDGMFDCQRGWFLFAQVESLPDVILAEPVRREAQEFLVNKVHFHVFYTKIADTGSWFPSRIQGVISRPITAAGKTYRSQFSDCYRAKTNDHSISVAVQLENGDGSKTVGTGHCETRPFILEAAQIVRPNMVCL